MKNIMDKVSVGFSWVKAVFILAPIAFVLLVCWWYLGSFYASIASVIMSWVYAFMIWFGFVFPAGILYLIALVVVHAFAVLVLPVLTFMFAISLVYRVLEK